MQNQSSHLSPKVIYVWSQIFKILDLAFKDFNVYIFNCTYFQLF